MDLSRYWEKVIEIAQRRLQNNITPRHISKYGAEIEIMGAAGELAARIFLGAPLVFSVRFDHGVDIVYGNHTIDVKSTGVTPEIAHKYLQIPLDKKIVADIVLMTFVDMNAKQASVVGYATQRDLENARVNMRRERPCKEIPFESLRPAWHLIAEKQVGGECKVVGSSLSRASVPHRSNAG